MIVTGLATIEGIWSLFSSESLIPFISTKVSHMLPLYPRIIAISVFGLLTVFGITLLVIIFKQTKHSGNLLTLKDIAILAHRHELEELQAHKQVLDKEDSQKK